MRGKTTLLFLAIALGLGGVIFWVDRAGPGSAERAAQANRILLFRADRAEAFEVEAGEVRLRGERRGEEWRLVHPIQAPADRHAVERMLSGFESLHWQSAIPRAERVSQGIELDAFGLDPPQARWTLWEGGQQHTLWLGRPTSVGAFVYLLNEASEEVLSVPNSVLRLLPNSVDALRERRVVSADPERTHRVELMRPEGFVQLVRGETGDWNIQQPRFLRGHADVVLGLATLLLESRVQTFVRDGPGEDAPFGFDETGVSASLAFDRPEMSGFRIDLGFPVPDRPGERYARVDDEPGIVTVSEDLYFAVRSDLNDLRDRQLLPFGPDAVRGVELHVGDERLELVRRSDDTWALAFPVEAPADPKAVMTFLRTWTDTRIERFLSPSGEGEAAPSSRRLIFRVSTARADPEETFQRVAWVIEPPNAEGFIPLRREDSGERVAVHPLRLRGFQVDPLAFVTRRPLRLDPAHFRGFTVRHVGQEWTVTLDADGRPLLNRAESEEATDALTARNQQALLLDLPVLRPISFGPDFLAEQGLEDPETVVRIHVSEEGGLVKMLALGRRGSEGVYVRIGDQDITYVVDPVVAETLRRKPVANEKE